MNTALVFRSLRVSTCVPACLMAAWVSMALAILPNSVGSTTNQASTLPGSPAPGHPGAFDPSFLANFNEWASIWTMVQQTDGKLLIGGEFTNVNGCPWSGLVRLHADGSLDTNYQPRVENPDAFALALQADGKVVIGGGFTRVNGMPRPGLARLSLDGTLDLGFAPILPSDAGVRALAIQSDGKVLAAVTGGTLTNATMRLVRLLADGTTDAGFSVQAGASFVPLIHAMVPQPSGAILVGGVFSAINGVPRQGIARLNSNGSVDLSFNPGLGVDGPVSALAMQPDGKVLVGGFFTTINGVPRSRIARLNTEGSVDTSFSANVDDGVGVIVPRRDGKILIGGLFSWVGGTPHNGVARLNANGTLDTSFDPGTGIDPISDGSVQAIATQADGKIVIADDDFLSFDGFPCNSICRLFSDPDVPPAVNLEFVGAWQQFIFGEARDVTVVGNRCYVALSSGGLGIFDVSNPTQPVRLGMFPMIGSAASVQVEGPYAYVVGGVPGLQIIDVSNPAHPTLMGQYDANDPSEHGRGVHVVGHYAYLALGDAGLQVIDASDPTQPVKVGDYSTAGTIFDLQVLGQYAYLASGNAGLEILDVTDPSHPRRVGGIDAGYARGLQVIGKYAYVADGEYAGLQVIDVSDPAHPVRVATCASAADARRVAVAGSYLYLACGGAGIDVIDVSDPLHSFRVGGYDTRGQASDVQVVDQYVYVADGHEGLVILRGAPVSHAPPVITQPPTHQTVFEGSTVTFSVGASGTPPLFYQWRFNGLAIPAATNATLTLSNVQTRDAGAYSVSVSNVAGSVLSSRAVLHVTRLMPLAEALDTPGWTWIMGSGSGAWFGQDYFAHYGNGAAQSGRISREQQTMLSTRVVGPGTIEFWWKVSSESHDYLRFFIGDQELGSLSGIVDWSHRAFYVSAGPQELHWSYAKNDELDFGLDTAWLDEVRFTTNAPGPTIVTVAPAAQRVNAENAAIFRAVATGVEPFRYQWRFNGANLAGETNAMLLIPHVTAAAAGQYSVFVNNPSGATTSSSATLSVSPPLALWDWVTQSTGTNAEYGVAVAVGPSGQVYVGGACDPGVARIGASAVTNAAWSPRALLVQYDVSGQVQWLREPGGWRVIALAVVPNGDVFAATYSNSAGRAEGTIAKYDSRGQRILDWTIFASGGARIRAIQTDPAGNVYVGGEFNGLLRLGSNEIASVGNADGFLAKFTGTGQLLWVTQVGDPERATVWSLGVDASGAAVILGEVTGGFIGTNTLAHGPFLVRLDSGGRLLWQKDGLDWLVAYASRLAVRSGGEFYLGGEFVQTIDLGTGPLVSNGREELLVAKFDSAGRPLWARQAQRLVPETYYDGPHAVAVDAAGNVWMQGHASGVPGFGSQAVAAGPTQRVAFVVKYKSDSALAWVKGAGLEGGSLGDSLAVDAEGHAYVVGATRGHARFGTNEISSPSYDLFVAQIIDSALPPVVVTPPESLTRSVGQTATFTVVVSGTPPLSYQWWRHLQPVADATNATLILSNLQPADAGAYSVIVSNAFGVTGAGSAFLTVVGPVNLEWVGTWPGFRGGNAVDVVVDGTTCYVALSEGGLAIFDVSDPLRPMPLGGWKNAGRANRLAVSGRYVYFADGPAGLQILDVSDPQHPTLVGRYPTSGIASAVQVVGPYAYLVSYDLGLEILDVRDPAHPVWVGGYDTRVEALAVHVAGPYAYVADGGGGLVILDVSNPTQPVEVGQSLTSDEAYDVQVVGRYAYVAYEEGGLHIVDVGDPAHPTLVGTYPLGESTWRLCVAGRYAYLADGEAGLQVIDVNDPAHPARVGSLWGMDVHAVHVVGPYAYIADEESGLVVADVSHPAQQTIVAVFPTQPGALDVQVVDRYAYLAAWRAGWHVIDVSNPAHPVRVGAFNTNGIAYGVKVVGARAYLADFSWGLRVLDISDPSQLVQLGGEWGSSADACKVDVAGEYAYVAERFAGLQVIAVSDPAHLNRVGAFTNGQPAWDVQVVGRYAYVANGHAGLQVIDVSDPMHPTQAGSVDVGYAYGVHVSGQHAYVAVADAGLRIIEVSDPSHPVSVGQCDTSWIAWDLFVVGPYAYIADGEAGVQVIDVSDPAHPRRAGGFHTGGDARNVYVAGNYVYVADMQSGLVILRGAPLTPPSPFVGREVARPTVQLVAAPPAGVSVYAVEDQVLPSAVVANISHGGVFDPMTGKVKFGPFYDTQSRTLSYGIVIPPGCLYGVCALYSFTGTASMDGVNTPIMGDAHMLVAGLYPADLLPADSHLTINEVTAYGAAWRLGQAWSVPPSPIPIDYVTRAGALWRWGECYTVDGSVTNEPLWWVSCASLSVMLPDRGQPERLSSAERRAPTFFVPGEPLTVALTVAPAGGTTAYAVEDQFPSGWTVSAISPGGEFDTVNGKVKWGPFLDNAPRTLTYQVTPPRTTSGPAFFAGVSSYDGVSVQIAGRQELGEGCRLHVGSQPISGQFEFTFAGRSGASFVFETSTDLITWTSWTTVSNAHGGLWFITRIQPDTPHRFFRARLAE